MKLTKYGHACVFIEKDNKRVVIDPGEFTHLPDDLSGIVAVVCTHMHGDHTHAENVMQIVNVNPEVVVYANPETMQVLNDINCTKVLIDNDKVENVGGFELSFYVTDHASIWQTSPCKNIAVKLDEYLYYPGDSFYSITDPVEVVAVPVSAPWLKMGDAIDFVRKTNAHKVIPTHNGLYNDVGHMIAHNWLTIGLEDTDKQLVPLQNGESVE